ncbi:MAG: CinA family protein [Mycoplasma sp.]|nr:CinA family protein [Mycoplasma sp.]
MKTISTVESVTSGLIASKITNTPGSSDYFIGSLVLYKNIAKEKLNIDTSNGVINKETALSMSKAGKEFFNSDICVATTGIAGKYKIEGKNPGTVFVAINEDVFELHLKGTRIKIKEQIVEFVLKKLETMK